jgi:hypothetical protein
MGPLLGHHAITIIGLLDPKGDVGTGSTRLYGSLAFEAILDRIVPSCFLILDS